MTAIFYLYLAVTVLLGIWLAFTVLYPRRWEWLVDKEYDFWVRLGVMRESTGGRIRRFEKGIGLKLSLWALFVFSLALTVAIASGEF